MIGLDMMMACAPNVAPATIEKGSPQNSEKIVR